MYLTYLADALSPSLSLSLALSSSPPFTICMIKMKNRDNYLVLVFCFGIGVGTYFARSRYSRRMCNSYLRIYIHNSPFILFIPYY